MAARAAATVVASLLALGACAGTDDPSPSSASVLGRRSEAVRIAGELVGVSPGAELLTATPADIGRELDVIAATGARWIRLDFPWPSLERAPAAWNFHDWDRLVAEATTRRLQVLGIIGYTPDWIRRSTAAGEPAFSPERFASFAGEMAAHFGPRGVRHWEVWNEPNLADAWGTEPDPAAYAMALTAAAEAIRAADPGATVVAGGLAATRSTGDGRRMAPDTFLAGLYAAGAGGAFDAVAVHLYGDPPDSAWAGVDAIRAVMAAAGDGDTPIWVTEYGAPTSGSLSEDHQAALVTAGIAAVQARQGTGPMFWYSARDLAAGSTDPFDNYGLVRHDFAPKPAFRAFDAAVGDDPIEEP